MGAVVAAAKVLRTLHDSERPLNASEVARAAGLHRGTAYNILKTLQAEGFVGYNEATCSYSVSLHILEIAYGVLRRSGLMDLARPLMHAVSDNADGPADHRRDRRPAGLVGIVLVAVDGSVVDRPVAAPVGENTARPVPSSIGES
jgi:IclR helix-turn-helix domain